MEAWVQSVVTFAAANQTWLPLIMAVFGAAETTAGLSILVPSTAILMGVGALAATGHIAFFPLWIGAGVGAILGSSLSWWLGSRYGSHILTLWPLKNYPDLGLRAEQLIARWGPVAVLAGHFIGPLRPVLFLVAGMGGMTFVRFQLYNVVGALSWAWIIPKLGQWGGSVLGWLWSHL